MIFVGAHCGEREGSNILVCCCLVPQVTGSSSIMLSSVDFSGTLHLASHHQVAVLGGVYQLGFTVGWQAGGHACHPLCEAGHMCGPTVRYKGNQHVLLKDDQDAVMLCA